MTQLIKRYSDKAADMLINPTDSAVTQTNWSSVIMPPGVYQYNEFKYDLNTEGLYAILNVNVDGGWRIIYQSDVSRLIQSVAWLIGYGRLDEGLTYPQMLSTMKTKKLSLRCGVSVAFLQSILTSYGITSRMVRLITAETPNNFDDGHVAVEVYIGGNWLLLDIASNCIYIESGTSNQRNLNTYFNGDGENELRNMCGDDRDLAGAGSYEFATNVYYDMALCSVTQKQAWIDRIFQIPGIVYSDGNTYFYMPNGTESRQSWLESLSSDYVVVSYSTWLSMFY